MTFVRCTSVFAIALAVAIGVPNFASARDWYVSKSRGKGKNGTKEKPSKDLGNIASKLKSGDVIHIAGGTYLGRGKCGAVQLAVGVTVIGGYDETFSKRDPWGATKTIMTGENPGCYNQNDLLRIYCNGDNEKVVVDGIVFDNGPRNHFKSEKKVLLLRKAGSGFNPSPETGGLRIESNGNCQMLVQNNIVMNVAASGGALSLWGGKGAKVTVKNNLIINNTGEGIFAFTKYHPRHGSTGVVLPHYEIHNNTVLFSWKHDAIATYGGNGLKVDTDVTVNASGNVFGFGDYGGVDNIKKSKNMKLKNNLFVANKLYDYREYNTAMRIGEMEDDAELLHQDTSDNVSVNTVKVNVGSRYASIYSAVIPVSRAQVDGQSKVKNTYGNAWRSILGLNLRGSTVKLDANIWLPKLEISEAIAAGQAQLAGKYGCKKP